MTRIRFRLPVVPILAAGLAVASLACKDANSITGVRLEHTPTPITPTPTPAAVNVAGDWTGIFNSFDFADCNSNVPATATLTQQGAIVEGTLNAAKEGCGTANVMIHATLAGSTFTGTIEGSADLYHFAAGSTVTGTLSGSTLKVVLTDAKDQFIPGGRMELHR